MTNAPAPLLRTLADLENFLCRRPPSQTLGFIPTLGALHEGHGSLIERARAETDWVLVSIFVNPLQFGPQEDFKQYPRTLEADCQLAERRGASAVFAPTPEILGLTGEETTLIQPPQSLTTGLCGADRPGHFAGVATIVAKLFNLIQPQFAYFGQKDAQQLAIIRRLTADLNFPVVIRACPTVREDSGLALSSRNQYLNAQEKEEALGLYRSLQAAQTLFQQGEQRREPLLEAAKRALSAYPNLQPQYLDLVDPQSLQPLTDIKQAGLLALAVRVGGARLIDNCLLTQRRPLIVLDGPAGAGKSTVTRRVADRLNFAFLDTGALYRALAYSVLQAQIDPQNESAVAGQIETSEVELIFQPAPQLAGAKLNGQEISEAIRAPEVTQIVSILAAQSAVRQKLLGLQRRYGEQGGLVAEGRDLGTQVFPDAELKIFLTASVEERARRRYQDFLSQGKTDISLTALAAEIQERDERDSSRTLSPLKKARDAIEINTDGLSIEAVVERVLTLASFLG
ncbi:MAG: bifunctional pantoate--beta-alanine ligase/(d)CMP kinase [Cyanobacteriota bacterium]